MNKKAKRPVKAARKGAAKAPKKPKARTRAVAGLDPVFLSTLLRYDFETGKLFWIERPLHSFNDAQRGLGWNRKFANTEAGCKRKGPRGAPTCIEVEIAGGVRMAHRLAWTIANGPIPDGMEIDHINGDPWDNKLSNLRMATHHQNMLNRKLHRDNTSGLKGVTWNKEHGKWRAQIRANGKKVFLGYHETVEAAHEAYKVAATTYHGQFASFG